MSKIRPPSPTLNRIRPISIPTSVTEPVRGLKEAKSYSEAFIACLRSLISEMRVNPNYFNSVKLANGERQNDFQNNYGSTYTFVLDDSDNVPGGSKVQVRYKGKVFPGSILRITNVSPRVLYLEIDRDLGSTIDICELAQDEAAFYEVLLERYSIETGIQEEGSSKKIGCNFSFADRVIQNKPEKISHKIIPPHDDLNTDQSVFVKKALDNNISYLWGPPGTGKTKCLGTLITALYDASERSIIASDTNQAVDQVLLKLCRELKANGRMEELEKGRILREGSIQNLELKTEFGQYLDIDSVTKLIAAPLKKKRDKLEKEKFYLELEIATFPELKKKIEQAEFWKNEVANLVKQETASKDRRSKAQLNLDEVTYKDNQLTEEIDAIGQRGFIASIFGKSRAKLELELAAIKPELEKAKELVHNLKRENSQIAEKLKEKIKNRDEHVKLTGGLTLSQFKNKQSTSQEKLNDLKRDIKKIQKELNDLSDKIIREARVIGATLTILFLLPAKIGKFENLIIDEASQAKLPYVHFASSLATSRVVISGDFRQLPPILETKNSEVNYWLGNNIFLFSKKNKSPISDIFTDNMETENAHMLEWQYRMPSEICELLSNFSYNSRLKTAPVIKDIQTKPPEGFNGSIVVLDTSAIAPFSEVASSGSRYNTIHAFIAERVANQFIEKCNIGTVGYCSPFRAQSDFVKQVFARSGLGVEVAAATIHTFQGDEKDTIIFDTVDGLGGAKRAGRDISKDNPDEANLLNVAISRAKQRIIIIANLKLLDQTLPAMAFLRQILAKADEMDQVISCENLLPFQKIDVSAKASLLAKHEEVTKLTETLEASNLEIKRKEKELQALQDFAKKQIEIKLADLENKEKHLSDRDEKISADEAELQMKLNTLTNEITKLQKQLANLAHTQINGSEFSSIFEEDIKKAKKTVLIYSGFATINRVQKCIELFRETISRGVKVRVVVRWGEVKGFFTKDGISAVELLQKVGVVVDLRADVHEKVILIDNSISWVGSLNPLSFNEKASSEIMWRVEGATETLKMGQKLALFPKKIRSMADAVKAENPRCGNCKSVTQYTRFKGKKFVCVSCKSVTPFGRVSK